VSDRAHSRYVRRLSDVAVGGQEVLLRLGVRRFFCDNGECARKTFAEQVPDLTVRYGRRTMLLSGILRRIALALGGRPAARLTVHLGVAVSRMTLLRLIRSLPDPDMPTPRVLGVDDFALRRGHHYGTVLIDIETRLPVDVLPDRSADSVAAWLQAHPGVEVVCRDRAGCYAEGASRGAPTAVQIADRWHLWHNLTEAVKKVVSRHRHCLRPNPQPQPDTDTDTGQGNADAASSAAGGERLDGPRAQRTRARHAEIHALVVQGLSVTQIGRRLNLDRKTVRRYAHASSPEDLIATNPTGRTSTLNPHKNYLQQRWEQGCTRTETLYSEIRQRGFAGSLRTLRRYTAHLRAALTAPEPPPPPKNHEIVGWLVRNPDNLTDDDRAGLADACHRCEELATTRDLVADFAKMICQLGGAKLEEWVNRAENGSISELRSFASGLRKDWNAVLAGLTQPYSSGAVEGNVTRIKAIKRQMYGRAHHDLLRLRILHPD
jgi:transposase